MFSVAAMREGEGGQGPRGLNSETVTTLCAGKFAILPRNVDFLVQNLIFTLIHNLFLLFLHQMIEVVQEALSK